MLWVHEGVTGIAEKSQRSAAHPGKFIWVAVSQQWDTLGMTEGLMWTSHHGFLSTHEFRSIWGLHFPLAGRGVPTWTQDGSEEEPTLLLHS